MARTMETPSENRCRECGKKLPPGRSDMKFCCPACKNRYHNLRGSRYRSCRLRVLNALERNHRILERTLGTGFRSMDLMEILSQGFMPEYCSQCRRNGRHLEYVCYDIRYHISAVRVWGIERIESVRRPSSASADP
ncbi:MAG: hypothetical protein IJL56_08385 [Bacteroidales bacterium]|nr:hypothetical protein [Bacteroidales bacterium]